MATQLYLRAWLSEMLWSTSESLKSHITSYDASRTLTAGADTLDLLDCLSASTTVGTGTGSARNTATVAGTTAGKIWAAVGCFSPPLAADVTISGTVNFAICASESSMNANATVRVAVYRVDKTGAFSLIVDSSFGTELTTSLARNSWSATPTSTAMKKGDRICIIPMIDDPTSATMASGHTVTIQYNGSNANTADSSVTFNENLTFITSAPSGTQYFLRDSASDVSGAKALSTTQGSGTATAVHTTVAGPLAFPGDLWTATAGGSDIEWYTPTLNAFTLGGVVSVELGSDARLDVESQFSPFDKFVAELAICDSDGTGAVVWSAAYAETHYNGVAAAARHYMSGADVSVSQGQRLRFRLYQDDFWYQGNDADAGTNRTLRYDGTSTYASALTFTQTITEGDPPAMTPIGKVIQRNQAVKRSYEW